jgi:hypothetical protein
VKDFAVEAERMRRAGDAHAAAEIAEAGLVDEPANDRGRMVLALALLDLGDVPRARQELEMAFLVDTPVAPVIPPPEPIGLGVDLGDDELESAFAEAETNPDEMMSANKVVEQTLESEHVDVPEAGFDVTGSPTYATETMASLLEEQGRAGDAEALRASLGHPEGDLLDDAENASAIESVAPSGVLDAAESMPASGAGWAAGLGPDHAERVRIVSTLEGWLHNLRQNEERDSRVRRSAAGGPSSS